MLHWWQSLSGAILVEFMAFIMNGFDVARPGSAQFGTDLLWKEPDKLLIKLQSSKDTNIPFTINSHIIFVSLAQNQPVFSPSIFLLSWTNKKQISFSFIFKSYFALIFDQLVVFFFVFVFVLVAYSFMLIIFFYYNLSERCITVTIISKSIIFYMLPSCLLLLLLMFCIKHYFFFFIIIMRSSVFVI